jgi:hypothetical protein
MRCWNRDAAAEGFHALQVAVGDGFAVIEEPVQPLERHVAIHLLEDIQEARDAFVVGRVQAERPAVRGEQRDDFLRVRFPATRSDRARLEEVLKVGRAEHEHFARAVAAEIIVAFARAGHFDPAREVLLLLLRLLREEIVGDAQVSSPRCGAG